MARGEVSMSLGDNNDDNNGKSLITIVYFLAECG